MSNFRPGAENAGISQVTLTIAMFLDLKLSGVANVPHRLKAFVIAVDVAVICFESPVPFNPTTNP